ncbi:MAG: MerR family transcriptional regulator [Jiangellaceae bacterium]
MGYTVGRVAALAGVSVRTLHHYDAVGLLTPTHRTEAGYRLYDADDLERLERILTYRELGFDLRAIAALLADAGDDRLTRLRRQRALLDERAARLERMRTALARRMEALEMGIDLSPEEILAVFGDSDPTRHAAEAEQRWGDTDAHRQSQSRTRGYGKREWRTIAAEADAIERGFAEALAAGIAPSDPAAMELAEAHRAHISRWFYDCTKPMHAAIAKMYVQDERFTQHYEQRAQGLAAYVEAAVAANAART